MVAFSRKSYPYEKNGSVAFVMLVRGDTNQKKAVQGSCPHEPYKHTFFYSITFGILPKKIDSFFKKSYPYKKKLIAFSRKATLIKKN
jgi:hypothetical protein